MSKKKRKIVRYKKPRIPSLSELKAAANERGMTTKEYVDHLAQLNRDHTGKRNRSASLDLGPEPYINNRGSYDRVEKGIRIK
jgi:hypothetical protein